MTKKNEEEANEAGPFEPIERFDDRVPPNDKKTSSERSSRLPNNPKAPPGSAQKSERS
jgi:hypothetical protein